MRGKFVSTTKYYFPLRHFSSKTDNTDVLKLVNLYYPLLGKRIKDECVVFVFDNISVRLFPNEFIVTNNSEDLKDDDIKTITYRCTEKSIDMLIKIFEEWVDVLTYKTPNKEYSIESLFNIQGLKEYVTKLKAVVLEIRDICDGVNADTDSDKES